MDFITFLLAVTIFIFIVAASVEGREHGFKQGYLKGKEDAYKEFEERTKQLLIKK